ncbi:innexin unc-9-like isoform X9 [Brachionus plicatilis]|uniref:Innexin n=2 Tax=Brachionus plicatilis TaxID=10195 RepID=A0A3M7Q1T9_BRAPC|nr:innexin unc-9-like isoform X9 [Brachionus plicatilis]
MNKYCWIKGTYYVEHHYDLNMFSVEARQESLLQYYQWVYFFLLFQAFLFYLPRIVWTFVSNKMLDYDLFNMVDAAIKYDSIESDRESLVRYLSASLMNNHDWMQKDQDSVKTKVKQIIKELDLESKKKGYNMIIDSFNPRFIMRKFSKSLLTLSYMCIKLIYLLNAFLQILLMNKFLSKNEDFFYGLEIFNSIMKGEGDITSISDSKVFPRITVCDVHTRELGSDHSYTVQCVLSFNLFNERIYAFLWFWTFFVVIPYTAVDLLMWIKRIVIFGSGFRYSFILSRVNFGCKGLTNRDKILIKLFTEFYIGNDGVFVLKLIEHNSNAIVVSSLVNKMWEQFKYDHCN